jgi:hypothetical protein
MKKVLFVSLVVALVLITGCSTSEEGTVCFTEDELEDMYAALEESDVSEEGSNIAYAPSSDMKTDVYMRLVDIKASAVQNSRSSVGEGCDPKCSPGTHCDDGVCLDNY